MKANTHCVVTFATVITFGHAFVATLRAENAATTFDSALVVLLPDGDAARTTQQDQYTRQLTSGTTPLLTSRLLLESQSQLLTLPLPKVQDLVDTPAGESLLRPRIGPVELTPEPPTFILIFVGVALIAVGLRMR